MTAGEVEMEPVGVALGPDLCLHELGEEGGQADGGHHHDKDVAGLVVVVVLARPEALERGGAEVLEGRFKDVGCVELVVEGQPEPLKSSAKAGASVQLECSLEAGKIGWRQEHLTDVLRGHEEVDEVVVIVEVLHDDVEDFGWQGLERVQLPCHCCR